MLSFLSEHTHTNHLNDATPKQNSKHYYTHIMNVQDYWRYWQMWRKKQM